jgi:hypothetical protein
MSAQNVKNIYDYWLNIIFKSKPAFCLSNCVSLYVSADIITGSKDKTVGVLRLGAPNHGCTEYSEVT